MLAVCLAANSLARLCAHNPLSSSCVQVASAMVDLASVLKLNDRPEEAQDNLQHALSIYEEALGEETTSVAAIQKALAELPLK